MLLSCSSSVFHWCASRHASRSNSWVKSKIWVRKTEKCIQLVKYDANKQNEAGTEIDQGWGKIWAAEKNRGTDLNCRAFWGGCIYSTWGSATWEQASYTAVNLWLSQAFFSEQCLSVKKKKKQSLHPKITHLILFQTFTSACNNKHKWLLILMVFTSQQGQSVWPPFIYTVELGLLAYRAVECISIVPLIMEQDPSWRATR